MGSALSANLQYRSENILLIRSMIQKDDESEIENSENQARETSIAPENSFQFFPVVSLPDERPAPGGKQQGAKPSGSG